jgi:2-oxoglutarate ferredoxin oxidoreductase subunit gamma
VPGSDEALKLNNMKVLNMIILGAFIKARKTVAPETVEKALYEVLPERHHKLIPLNLEAFKIGMSFIKD